MYVHNVHGIVLVHVVPVMEGFTVLLAEQNILSYNITDVYKSLLMCYNLVMTFWYKQFWKKKKRKKKG